MANKKSKTLMIQDVVKIAGVSERTVKYWKQKDSMFPAIKVGRSLHFDPVKLRDWLLANDRDEQALRLTEWLKKEKLESGNNKKKSKVKKTLPKSKAGRPPGAGADNPSTDFSFPYRFTRGKPVDVFAVKEMTGELLRKLVNDIDGSNIISLSAFTKNLNNITDGFRKLEESCIDIDTQLGNVVPLSDVRKYDGEIMTRIKTDLRALPYAVADDLVSMTDPQKISSFLKSRIDDALRHLAKGINEAGKKSAG